MSHGIVTIKKDAYQEYRVPAPDGGELGAYYTDCRDDARDTCHAMWGDAVIVKFRTVREHS